MKYVPYIIYAVFILFIGFVSFCYGKMMFVCGNEIHPYNVANYKLEREIKFHKALREGLQWYMENDSALCDTAFVKTREYQRIMSLIGDEFNTPDEDK
ncbi:MAG: hypothetical protein IKW83_01520 [Muribaculaceae bacterium]|nr:hypothetical protein [Muribaculaceae bacterium]